MGKELKATALWEQKGWYIAEHNIHSYCLVMHNTTHRVGQSSLICDIMTACAVPTHSVGTGSMYGYAVHNLNLETMV